MLPSASSSQMRVPPVHAALAAPAGGRPSVDKLARVHRDVTILCEWPQQQVTRGVPGQTAQLAQPLMRLMSGYVRLCA